jgi:hypothetical protein
LGNNLPLPGRATIRLFAPSRFLDADIEDWVLETWGWLMANLGGMERFQQTPLVTASRECFPPTDTEGHARALYVFEQVKQLMGMQNRPCTLRAFERSPDNHRVGLYAQVQRGGTANGTFQIRDGEVIIRYASDLVTQPRQLIATFAHELSHYLLATIMKPIPGGNDLHELTTELTVAYTGFGIFGANAAFRFEQHQDSFGQGWSASRSGYFSEPTWAFALAMFAHLRQVELPRDQLKPSIGDLTRKAGRYLEKRPALLAPLRNPA